MTTEQLKQAEARYQRAHAKAEAARLERNAAINAALEAGWTPVEIGAELGMTRTRVDQIGRRALERVVSYRRTD